MLANLTKGNELNRRNVIFYHVRRWAANLETAQSANKSVRKVSREKPVMVTILKDGIYKKANLSTLARDSFTKTGKYEPPLIIVYSNRI